MRLFRIAISCLILFSVFACEKFQNENNKNELSVTGHAEDITGISATLICYANFTDNVFGDVTVGVQVSESESFNGGGLEVQFQKLVKTGSILLQLMV